MICHIIPQLHLKHSQEVYGRVQRRRYYLLARKAAEKRSCSLDMQQVVVTFIVVVLMSLTKKCLFSPELSDSVGN